MVPISFFVRYTTSTMDTITSTFFCSCNQQHSLLWVLDMLEFMFQAKLMAYDLLPSNDTLLQQCLIALLQQLDVNHEFREP